MIAALRKQTDDGTTYLRPPEIEEALKALYQLPVEEVALRASINDPEDPDYVRSECVLHFVRQSKANGDAKPYLDLFGALRNRVIRAVPIRLRKIVGVSKPAEMDSEAQIQDKVLFDFQKLLCLDRQEYDERLDYYEIRFNSAIATLRATARRTVAKQGSRRKPMEYDGDASGLSLEMEQALARLRDAQGEKNEDVSCRLRLIEAISSLRPNERRVIELMLEGVPIDSKEPGNRTIARIIGCSEKTVRNRRDRAYAALKEAMKEEEVA